MPKAKVKRVLPSRELILPAEEMSDECVASLSDSGASEAANEVANETANLQTILQELRDSRRENGDGFREIKEEIKNINGRLNEAESRIMEVEDRTQRIEEAALELSKAHDELEAKIIELEERSRRDNIRLHGIIEGSEDNSTSVSVFIENLLRDKLDIPASLDLSIERAHRSLGPKAPLDAPPRSIIVKFTTFKTKDEVLRLAWQKKGFTLDGKRVIVDHDYAPDVLKRRREYTEAKRVLREKKIKFQTPYPAKLRVFYEDDTRVYNSAAEATTDMVNQSFAVNVIKPTKTWVDKIKSAMWLNKSGETERPNGEARDGYKKKLDAYRRE